MNVLLLDLLTLAWAADRRGSPGWAGVWVGTAAALKLFPGFLVVSFVATRRRRAVATGAVTFAVLNLGALAVFRPGAFRAYATDVPPGVERYQSSYLMGHTDITPLRTSPSPRC